MTTPSQLRRLESDTLLDLFLTHAIAPERTLRWRWTPGDIAIWDNQSVIHNLVLDYGPQERLIYRVTVGESPLIPAASSKVHAV
jgi:alpha-ketoglutarate-dependent sulfate ester dioxygenase